MKKLSLFFYVILCMLFSCQKDENMVVLNTNIVPPQLSHPVAGAELEITSALLPITLDFAWSKTEYGVSTQVTYAIEAETKCGDFSAPIVLGTSNASNLSLTYDFVNSKLISGLKLAPHVETDIQLRVVSTINNKYRTVSDVVSVKVTPYSDAPAALWLGENSANAPFLFATGASTYEGYRYMKAGTSFRVVNNRACADVIYGAGSAVGTIASGAAAPITMHREGFYKFNIDTDNLTVDTLLVDWGMIGDATPGSWDNSTAMTYDPDKDVWTGDVDLVNGALKFRANNGWDLNYGPADVNALTGTLKTTNDAISIGAPATYTVTIDFRQNVAPYAYSYSVAESLDIPEPPKLWLPGGYQGYHPDLAPTIYAINESVYEGYVYISAGTGFKFTSAPDWDHVNYGYGGSPGVLSTDGLAPDIGLDQGGYYKLRADLVNLTYSAVLVNTWGLIGTSTTGAWDNSTPMTYDAGNDVWTVTTDLAVGALKFRANNDWGLNYGPAVIADLEGQLVSTDNSINIAEAGNYTVTLNFSRKQVPYKYTYKVKHN